MYFALIWLSLHGVESLRRGRYPRRRGVGEIGVGDVLLLLLLLSGERVWCRLSGDLGLRLDLDYLSRVRLATAFADSDAAADAEEDDDGDEDDERDETER